MDGKRYFTAAEVNALIPELERTVAGIQEKREQLARKVAAVRARRAAAGPGADLMQEEAEVDFLATLLQAAYKAIEAMGGVIKHPDATLVDFLGRGPDGEDVWLCWRYGEKRIGFYHPIDRGFDHRRPLQPGM